MANFKNFLAFAFMATSIFLLSNCGTKEIIKCGNSTNLGTIKFSDSTKTLYSTWTGSESLIFKDSLGNEEEWYAKEAKKIDPKYQFVTAVLCDSGILDRQFEYYDAEWHYLALSNRNTANTRYFTLDLRPDRVGKRDSAFVAFNIFSLYDSEVGSIKILSAHDKPVPASAEKTYVTTFNYTPKFVADTTILGKNFKNVYYKTNDFQNNAVFFQKSKMIIGYKTKGKTWLFDRIK